MAQTGHQLLEAAARVVGTEAVHAGTVQSAVGGVVPGVVVTPASVEGLTATLRWAAKDRLRVMPVGAGTKRGWGSAPSGIDIVVSTARLSTVREHRHGDLTATVEAGAPLAAVNAELGHHSQWIPLDPSHAERATIGGIVATNDSGPRRHRHGAPRDLIIGVTFARADGEIAKAGGMVVKNVAGYDLSKLLSGSFGSLGVIVSATFKLAPVPPASRTVAVEFPNATSVGQCVLELLASQLTPSAVELEGPPYRLLMRFETVEAAAEHQAADVAERAKTRSGRARTLTDAEQTDCWARHAARPWDGAGAVVKIGLLPSHLAAALDRFEELLRANGAEGDVVGRAGLGVLYARIDGTVEAQAGVIEALRAQLAQTQGYVSVLRGSPELNARIDAWGPLGDAGRVMRAIKHNFDPDGLLSPGRWPIG